jgi:cell division protein FtsQ
MPADSEMPEINDADDTDDGDDPEDYEDFDPGEYDDGPVEYPEEKPEDNSEEYPEEKPEKKEDPEEIEDPDAGEDVSYGLSEKDSYEISDVDELIEKIEQRKQFQKKRNRAVWLKFWGTIIAGIAVIAAFLFSLSDFFSVDTIQVKGNSHFSAEEIINISHAVRGHNLIYDPGKKDIIDYLEHNPYIKSAEVRRKLPSTLVISVKEREELFAFGYDDDFLIMDNEGILLRKTRTQPKLTLVEGVIVSKIKLGEEIGAKKQIVLDKCLKLMRTMKKGDLYFVRVDLTDIADGDTKIRAYIYDNLAVRSEYDLLIDAIEDGRLHLVVEKLVDDGISRGTILVNDDETISYQPGF